MLNLATVFCYSAEEHPDKIAIIFGDKRFTFGQVDAAVNQLANALMSEGIKKGDKIALSCPNLPYFPMIYYAILKAGAIVVPLNVLLKAREIAYHLRDSEARGFFCFQGTPKLPMAREGYEAFEKTDSCEHFWVITADPTGEPPIEGAKTMGQIMASQPVVFDMVHTSSDDTAVIYYTSGTTGFPKGAELSHCNAVMNTMVCKDLMQLTHDDRHAVVLPLFHSFGQIVQMNSGFFMGNTLILIPNFEPEAIFNAIQHEWATVFAGVPTMYWALLAYDDKEHRFDLEKIASTLRLGVSGGSSLPLEIIKGMEEKYQIPIMEGYGLSETSPVATFNHLHKERKPGSIGTPIWGVEVKIFNEKDEECAPGEVGEVVVRGHNVMKGYYNNPEATEEAFNGTSWFHTGDLGRMDEDGYFYIVDRLKDMIIRGGFNIYPREIEEVLMTHPAVSLASVIGIPHDRHGEEVKAYIVLKEGDSVTEDQIVQWSKEQMAAYKYPRVVEFRKTLPMTATGKILKKELRAEIT